MVSRDLSFKLGEVLPYMAQIQIPGHLETTNDCCIKNEVISK